MFEERYDNWFYFVFIICRKDFVDGYVFSLVKSTNFPLLRWRCLALTPVWACDRYGYSWILHAISAACMFLVSDWYFFLLLQELYLPPRGWCSAGRFHKDIHIGNQCMQILNERAEHHTFGWSCLGLAALQVAHGLTRIDAGGLQLWSPLAEGAHSC